MFSSILQTILLSCACVNGLNVGTRSNSTVNDRVPTIKRAIGDGIDIGDFNIYHIEDLGYKLNRNLPSSSQVIDENDVIFYVTSTTNTHDIYWSNIHADFIEFSFDGVFNSFDLSIDDASWCSYNYNDNSDRLYYEHWGSLDYTVGFTFTPLLFGIRKTVIFNDNLICKQSFYDFTFNKQINRFAAIGGDDFNSKSPIVGITPHLYTIFNGLFYDDNGVMYKSVEIFYDVGQWSNYIDYSTQNPTYVEIDEWQDQDSTTVYGFLQFTKLNNDVHMVNKQDRIIRKGVSYISNTSSWTDEIARFVHIIDVEDANVNLPCNTSIGVKRFTMFNDGYIGSSYSVSGGGIGNVTNIIYTGLGGISGLFGLTILPGISLGLLIFLPLIFSLLLFILKLFKR